MWVGDYPYVQRPKFRSFVDNTLMLVDGEETEGGGVVSVSAMGRRSSGGKRSGTSRSSSSGDSSSSSGVSSSRSSDMNTSVLMDKPIPLQRQTMNRVMERTTGTGTGTPLQTRFNTKERTNTRASVNKQRPEERIGVGVGPKEGTERDNNNDVDMRDRGEMYEDDDPLQDVQAWLDENNNLGKQTAVVLLILLSYHPMLSYLHQYCSIYNHIVTSTLHSHDPLLTYTHPTTYTSLNRCLDFE